MVTIEILITAQVLPNKDSIATLSSTLTRYLYYLKIFKPGKDLKFIKN